MTGLGRAQWVLICLFGIGQAGAFTVGPDGWTVLEPSADSQVIHVSSSLGNNANPGTSVAPVQTILEGMLRLRDGFPDYLLLRRGDVWHEAFGFWSKSGRSIDEPMVVGSYGSATARPRVIADNEPGLRGLDNDVNFFAFTGIHLQIENRPQNLAPTGIRWLAPTNHLLFEDLLIEGFSTNIVVQGYFGDISNFQIRRCVVIDSFDTETLSQGMYCENVDGILIEECLFDYNGWKESQYTQTIFNHNVYIHAECSGLTARGNVFSRSSSHGLQARPGGIVENNLFIRCPVSCSYGFVLGGSDPTIGGVGGMVSGNVFLESNDIADKPRGIGLQVGNIAPSEGAQITNNLFIRNDSAQPYGAAIELQGSNGLGINNTLVQGNVCFGYNAGLTSEGATTGFSNTNVRFNYFLPQDSYAFVVHHRLALDPVQMHYQGNIYNSPRDQNYWFRANSIHYSLNGWKTLSLDADGMLGDGDFPDSSRSISSYSASQGFGGSVAGFLTEARKQSRQTWDPACAATTAIDYFRVGFGGTASVEYTVETVATGDGAVTLSPQSETYNFGQTVLCTAVPQPGHRFLYWEGDLLGETSNPAPIMVNSDKAIGAVFVSNSETLYSFDFQVQGMGNITLLPPGNEYPPNAQVLVTALPQFEELGNRFVRYEGDLSSVLKSTFVVMNDFKNVTVVFEGVEDVPGLGAFGLLAAATALAFVARRRFR